MRKRTPVLLACVLLGACESSPDRPPGTRSDAATRDAASSPDASTDAAEPDGGAGEDAGPGDTGEVDGGTPITIPDPGTAMNDWGFNVIDVCCSTPDTAYPVGTVTMNPGYVQGNIDVTSGDFFYVFRSGPALTELTWTGFLTLDLLDLHDGDGLVFGPVVPATSTGQNTATWTVMPNHVYVLHLHSPDAGFF